MSIFYSQFGEDRILNDEFAQKSVGVCVEVGGYDGITGSTTYFFEKLGWKCLVVEPILELCERIKTVRSCIVNNCAASSVAGSAIFTVADNVEAFSSFNVTKNREKLIQNRGGKTRKIEVITKKLDQILEEANIGHIDFITIDVEGHELDVLKGFSLAKYRPRIVIVEDNSLLLDVRIQNYMKTVEYSLFMRTGVNDWYAHECDQELLDAAKMKEYYLARKRNRLKNIIRFRFASIIRALPRSARKLGDSSVDYFSRHFIH